MLGRYAGGGAMSDIMLPEGPITWSVLYTSR